MPSTIKATVAPHRSLVVGGVMAGSGQEVEVAVAEYPGLVAAGFLVNPDAPQPTFATGPHIEPTDDKPKPFGPAPVRVEQGGERQVVRQGWGA